MRERGRSEEYAVHGLDLSGSEWGPAVGHCEHCDLCVSETAGNSLTI
jgi:hypothetical protein